MNFTVQFRGLTFNGTPNAKHRQCEYFDWVIWYAHAPCKTLQTVDRNCRVKLIARAFKFVSVSISTAAFLFGKKKKKIYRVRNKRIMVELKFYDYS